MLSRLYATNYRCLVNFEFRPGAKQLIIGRNGAGKTSVFDVLAMLRDIAVRKEPCEGYLGGKTRTSWQKVPEQRFELEVKGNGGEYLYTLVISDISMPPPAPRGPSVKIETLHFKGELLFRFEGGVISVFDQTKASRRLDLRAEVNRSGLPIALAQLPDQTITAWFSKWLSNVVQVQTNPWAMSARSEQESREPKRDLSNFSDWYRHLLLDSSNAVFEAINDLRQAIPTFEGMDAKEAGLDVRVLQAKFAGPSGRRVELIFDDLSEGQRVLIALYVLMHCSVGEDRLLLIDEPDNFIALSEIQPWLMKLLDRVDETNGQVILVSHHPELLDQLAGQGGVLFDRLGGLETRVRPFSPPEDSGLKPSEIIARGWESA